MVELPSGTVTFLFTDIEGSTRLFQQLGERYSDLLCDHQTLVRAAIEEHGGVEVSTEGDSFFVAFGSAGDAVGAAVALQRALSGHRWPDRGQVRVRAGVHTGDARPTPGGNYVALAVHQAARISAAAHGGQVLLSDATRRLAVDTLGDGVGLVELGSYRLKDFDEPERLWQLIHPELPNSFPPPRTLHVLPTNVAAEHNSLVGRDLVVEEIADLLTDHRVVTLAGAGGSGKTRLAQRVGAAVLEGFEDGVWFVDLSDIHDADQIVQAVLRVLDVRADGTDRPLLTQFVDVLRRKHLVVILDNCEQILDAVAEVVGRTTAECPRTRLLLTSREPLGVDEEVQFRVPPLAVPPAGAADVDVDGYDAVRLFADRARRHRPGFRLEAANRAAVASICRRLDGMPLAIELAAARVRHLDPDDIAERLEQSLQFLVSGRRGVERQRTLEATIAWSHELLEVDEQTAFRRLAVFAGGFSLEAASQVAAPDLPDVEEIILRLSDKSLVEWNDDTRRYRLLQTMRDYAMVKLDRAGETASTRDRHLAYYLGLAERVAPEFFGPRELEWTDTLETDFDNFVQAINWAAASAEDNGRLMLATALCPFLVASGRHEQAAKWLAPAGDEEPAVADDVRFRALTALTWARSWGGRYAGAVRSAEAAAELAERIGQPCATPGLIRAEAMSAMALACLGTELDRADELIAQARTWAEVNGDNITLAYAFWARSLVLRERDDMDATSQALASFVKILRRHSPGYLLGDALFGAGVLALEARDTGATLLCFSEALPILTRSRNWFWALTALHHMADAAAQRDDLEAAEAYALEALRVGRRSGQDRPGTNYRLVLQTLASLDQRVSRFADATAKLRQALALSTGKGQDRFHDMVIRYNLAEIAEQSGHIDEALVAYRTALREAAISERIRLVSAVWAEPPLAPGLEGIMRIWAAHERWADAARLLGAANARREGIEASQLGQRGPSTLAVAERIRTKLDKATLSDLLALGASTLDDTVALALEGS